MLDVLRSNARSVLTYVLFGIIIVVFVVSFGPGSRGCGGGAGGGGASYAAKVNGEAVSRADLEQHYAQLFRLYQQRAGQAFTRELADQLGLRSQALNQLVDRQLVLQEAEKHGVRVTDDDLSREVKSITSFQSNGRFDHDLYTRTVNNTYGSAAHFEQQLREDLTYQRMMALVRQGVKLSDDEVKDAWTRENDQVDLEVVRIPLEAARKEVKVTDAEVKAFAEQNAQQIEARYREQPDRWNRQKQVRARHILVRAAENAPAEVEDAAKKKIEAAAERVKKGEDFAKLAKEISEDPGSKDQGGDLGFFGPGVMAKPFEEAAGALKPGEVSGPVRTRFGWHLIKAEEVREPEQVSLEKARDELARELLVDERAKKLAAQKGEEILARARGAKSLAALFPAAPEQAPADKKGAKAKAPAPAAGPKLGGEALTVDETGLFGAAGDFVPKVGSVPGLVADALAAQGGALLPKVYEQQGGGAVVARVKERKKPDPARYAAEKDEFANRLRAQREGVVTQAWLKGVREKAKIDVNREALASARVDE